MLILQSTIQNRKFESLMFSFHNCFTNNGSPFLWESFLIASKMTCLSVSRSCFDFNKKSTLVLVILYESEPVVSICCNFLRNSLVNVI